MKTRSSKNNNNNGDGGDEQPQQLQRSAPKRKLANGDGKPAAGKGQIQQEEGSSSKMNREGRYDQDLEVCTL
jgi:hypothetical protein